MCDKCGKTFEQKMHLATHKKVHESPELVDQMCESCGTVFTKKSELKKHKCPSNPLVQRLDKEESNILVTVNLPPQDENNTTSFYL